MATRLRLLVLDLVGGLLRLLHRLREAILWLYAVKLGLGTHHKFKLFPERSRELSVFSIDSNDVCSRVLRFLYLMGNEPTLFELVVLCKIFKLAEFQTRVTVEMYGQLTPLQLILSMELDRGSISVVDTSAGSCLATVYPGKMKNLWSIHMGDLLEEVWGKKIEERQQELYSK